MNREPVIGFRCSKCSKELLIVKPADTKAMAGVMRYLTAAKRRHATECGGRCRKVET